MRIAIASGKGGTGKTLVATNIAEIAPDVLLVDLDVEEPNDYLFFEGEVIEKSVVGRLIPVIEDELCNRCGDCARICAYHAIAVLPLRVVVFNELCHGCGGCSLFCDAGAISEKEIDIGTLIRMKRGSRELIYGELKVGEAMAPPLIRRVKSQIPSDVDAILDCSPGTSCPVIESVRGSNYCLIVTEPTPFGLHDLDLTLKMLRRLKLPAGVVINKDGISGADVEGYCERHSLPILGRVPFSREIAEKYANGKLLVGDRTYAELFTSIWANVREEVERK